VSLAAFGIVLFAAVLHASWNAIVKGAGDTTLTTVLVVGMAGIVGIVILPFVPQPAPASWPYLGVSMVLQVGYYLLVAAAYQAADMSAVYPLMRGVAPLLVAGVGTVAIGEHPTPLAWAGIALVSGGVLSLAFGGRAASGRGIALALGNAVVIATYTLVDGTGVRLSGSPAGYTLWLAVMAASPFVGWILVRRRAAFLAHARRYYALGTVGGIATLASYGLALWAMTVAPVAVVAALRETSILFGTLIAALILRERITLPRLIATGLIAAGAIVLRLA
jgi:drug/metabolite transporter (DMT)-like permease